MTKFKRHIAPARLQRLCTLAQADGWFRDLLLGWKPSGVAGGLRLAVRDGYLNFYSSGQSIACVKFGRGGAPYAWVHHKYVERKAPPTYVRFELGDTFDVAAAIAAAETHVGAEKRAIEAFVAAEAGVIDLEMGLPAEGERTSARRIDLVALESVGDGLRLALWEAKRIGDKRLRAAEGPAEVVAQSEAYRAFVASNCKTIAEAYRDTAKVLVTLANAAGCDDAPGDLIRRLTKDEPLTIDPNPRLLIIDDGGDRNIGAWNRHLRKLHDAGIPVHVAGTTDAALPTAETLAATPPPELVAAPAPRSDFAKAERARQQAWADLDGVLMPD